MALEKVPFQRYKLDEEKAEEKGKVLPVWLNNEEYAKLLEMKKLLQQPKDSTTLKTLAILGTILIEQDLTGKILQVVLKNIAKNERLGIQYVE